MFKYSALLYIVENSWNLIAIKGLIHKNVHISLCVIVLRLWKVELIKCKFSEPQISRIGDDAGPGLHMPCSSHYIFNSIQGLVMESGVLSP